ncbi:MAG: hypothetical protein ABI273_03575 [Lacunisphaera sp.]
MNFRQLRLIVLPLLLTAPVFLHAQETTANEDERIEQLVRSEASEWYTPKDSVSVGFHILTSGAKVRFGNLGSVASSSLIAPASVGAIVDRVYDNGSVNLDSPRAEELNANGAQKTQPGSHYYRYTVDADGNQIVATDSIAYTPGLTRNWSYSTADQTTTMPGYVGMSSYSATSDGQSFSKKQGASAGVELQFAHAIRKFGKRTELSFVAGAVLNSINNKVAGDVHSTLHTLTEYYALPAGATAPVSSDVTAPVPYTGPSYDSTGSIETTVPLATSADPSLTTRTATPGGTAVHGLWEVKGAYFMLKLGPAIRTQLTDRFGVSASVGVAGAYVGTHYSAVESMDIPLVGTVVTNPSTDQDSDKSKFMAGYYADFSMEWATNDTLGFFGGVSAQKLGQYTQTLGTRDALIDLGSAVGLRGGLNIKF